MIASFLAVATMAYLLPALALILRKKSPNQWSLLRKLFAAALKAWAARFGFFFSRVELISLPPDILLFGHRFSQLTKWSGFSHLLKSTPVSASISRALVALSP